jgi:hypothetical protein
MARVVLMQGLIDALSSLNLALEAGERLSRGGRGALLGWAELLVAAFLVAATLAMLRGHARFGRWVEGLAGAVLLLDGLSKTYGPKGHPSWALTLNGLVLIGIGALAPQLEARREARRGLRLDDGGLTYRRNRWRRFVVARGDIREVAIGPRDALVHTTDGRSLRIDLTDLRNRAQVERGLREWATATGVPLT